jgi:hypothetical protein
MSTKPFKDIEQMMKAAAEGYEQPFEEAAWRKMEVLLDGEKDRRRPVFWLWWLLPVFIGTGIAGYFLSNKIDEPAGSITVPAAGKINPEASVSPNKIPPHQEKFPQSPVKASIGESSIEEALTTRKLNSSATNKARTQVTGFDNELNKNNPPTNARERVVIAGKTDTRVRIKTGENLAVADPEKEPAKDIDKTAPGIIETAPATPIDADQPGDAKKPELTKPVPPGNDTVPSADKKTGKKPGGNNNNSRWYLVLAGGAEGSSPRVFEVDKISAKGGAVIGYQLNKNISLQTGFFAGSKKYIAGPTDYKAKAGTYWSTVEIVEVDANCLVYEIPLNLRYDILPGKATNIFATAGLSSYIMKKEDYEYSYNRYGYAHYAASAYKGNKHPFSVLRLSAGVERKLSKNFSLNTAPALSVPLAGVGEGQVKLYSAEIMLGLKYQPLKKSKNK